MSSELYALGLEEYPDVHRMQLKGFTFWILSVKFQFSGINSHALFRNYITTSWTPLFLLYGS